MKPKYASASVVKNEAQDLIEWIAYQYAVGFDCVILMDNNSTDITREIVQRFTKSFDIRLIQWWMSGTNYQDKGYENAIWSYQRDFAWCACTDADELLVLPEGMELPDLFNVPDDVAAIGMPWAIFGSNDHVNRPRNFMMNSYLRRSEMEFSPNRHIKSIVKPNRVIHCFNSHYFIVDGKYVDPTHRVIEQPGTLLTHPVDYSRGKLHHYLVKSQDDWAAKMARGYHNMERRQEEFTVFNRNEVFDASARRYLPKVQAVLAQIEIDDLLNRFYDPAQLYAET